MKPSTTTTKTMKTLTALTAILGISISLTMSAHADLIAEADPLIINNDQNQQQVPFEIRFTNTGDDVYIVTSTGDGVTNRKDFMSGPGNENPLKKGQSYTIKGQILTGTQGVETETISLFGGTTDSSPAALLDKVGGNRAPLKTFTIKVINKGLPTFSSLFKIWTNNNEETITITKDGWNLKDARSLQSLFSVETTEDAESIKLKIHPLKDGKDQIRVILSHPSNPDRIYNITAWKK